MKVWQKNDLPKSDSQQPSDGSNATCNLRLSQAGYYCNGQIIDQTSYFRNKVFSDCDWRSTPKGEITHIDVHLEIDGEYKGDYTLKVTHEEHRESHQDNVTTILHWEDAIPALTEHDVTGKNLMLYKEGDGAFTIKIQ